MHSVNVGPLVKRENKVTMLSFIISEKGISSATGIVREFEKYSYFNKIFKQFFILEKYQFTFQHL